MDEFSMMPHDESLYENAKPENQTETVEDPATSNQTQLLSISTEMGNIYYQWNDEADDFDIYRVTRIQNGDTVSCTCTIRGQKPFVKKIKLSDLKKNYSQLISNAIITASKVIVAQTEDGRPVFDIVIMVYKRDGNQMTFGEPDIVCRQALSDIYYEPFCNQEENPYVGLCASQETIPAGYTMQELTACDKVLESVLINTYRTDTLDSIYTLLNLDNWNNVLEDLAALHHKQRMAQNPFLSSNEIPMIKDGYCKNIMTLLKYNNFMYDFYRLLGVVEVNFKIEYDENNPNEQALPLEQVEVLQEIYEVNISRTMVAPFDYTIDLSKAKMNYLLVMDNAHVLYIVVFTKSPNEYVKVVDTSIKTNDQIVHEKLLKAATFYDKYSN